MVADNDAGGITIYEATGAKYCHNPVWVILLLIRVCYYLEEMTDRVGGQCQNGVTPK